MSAVHLPILYSFRRCPYAMRARMALQAAGVEVEHREVLLKDKPAQMLALSPKGTVPVLQCSDGTVLEESIDIMYWALERNDPLGWLPHDPSTRSHMHGQLADFEARFKPSLDAYKYSARQPSPEQNVARLAAREHCERMLQDLEAQLAGNDFLGGNAARFADVALMPFVRQFAHVDFKWFGSLPCVGVQRWLEYWLRSELFARIMTRHPQWVANV